MQHGTSLGLYSVDVKKERDREKERKISHPFHFDTFITYLRETSLLLLSGETLIKHIAMACKKLMTKLFCETAGHKLICEH